jgi:hypothetical protein
VERVAGRMGRDDLVGVLLRKHLQLIDAVAHTLVGVRQPTLGRALLSARSSITT